MIQNYLMAMFAPHIFGYRRFFVLSLLCCLFFTISTPAWGQSQPVIIVHPDNPISEIKKDELVKIFRLTKTTWGDGVKILSVNLKVGNPARESFFSTLLGEDPKQIEALYRKKARGATPKRKVPSVMGRGEKRGAYGNLAGRNKKRGGYNQRRYESKSVYTPKTFKTEKEVVQFVSKNRGSIGYVLQPDSSVKVVSFGGASVQKKSIGQSVPVKKSRVKSAPKKVAAKGDFFIIVHPENPRDTISKEELQNIFNVRKTRWKDGTDIKSANLKAEHPLRDLFSTKVLSKSPKEMDAFYRKKLKKAPPKPVPSILGGKSQKGAYSNLSGKRQKRGGYDQRRFQTKKIEGPRSFKAEKDILGFVADNKGSIGYVSTAGPSVKILKVTGLPPVKLVSANAQKQKAVSVKKTVTETVAKIVPKVVPIVTPKIVPKPAPKPKPKVPAAIAPASLASETEQTLNVNHFEAIRAADITIKGPSFEAGRKGPIRASKEIRVHIPPSLAVEWDASVPFIKISGNARKSLKKWVNYSKDRKTLRIQVVSDFPSGGVVVLSGMKFANAKNPSATAGFLWLEVDNNGTRESVDDKPVWVKEGLTHLVLSAPLSVIPHVGVPVEALLPKTEVAGNPFQVEVYLVDEKGRRVGKDRQFFVKETWVSPANPVSKKHIVTVPSAVALKRGYAKISVSYPEAGTINLVASEGKDGPLSSGLKVLLRPAYLTITAAACGISGEPLPVIVSALNAEGMLTENYEGNVMLRSRHAFGTAGGAVPRPEDRSIPITGGKTEVQYAYSDAGPLLFSATGAYLKNEFIETKDQKVVCFRPSAFRVIPAKPAPDRKFFYTASKGCASPDHVDVNIEAVNSKGQVTQNFLGEVLLETDGGQGLTFPGPQRFTEGEKGVKVVADSISSAKEQSLAIKAKGTMNDGLCQCDSFSGISKKITFRQGNILVTPKTGIAGGLIRKRTGKIVQVSRATSSGQLSVPVTLRFNNGDIITEDNNTQVSVAIESETGMVRNSASIEGNERFRAVKGKGVFHLTDSEGENVTVATSSSPCLASESGKISFSEDKVVILTSSGHFSEELDVRIEVHDKSGSITKKYDGTVIEGLSFEPKRDYMLATRGKAVIKGGVGLLKVKNSNPETGKMELIVVTPQLKGEALIVKPGKIRFRGVPEKEKSSFSDLIGKKIKSILGK